MPVQRHVDYAGGGDPLEVLVDSTNVTRQHAVTAIAETTKAAGG